MQRTYWTDPIKPPFVQCASGAPCFQLLGGCLSERQSGNKLNCPHRVGSAFHDFFCDRKRIPFY
ncbi:MAG: hypothetical protein IKK38_03280 [Spirochaetaceae bacterium]|nr:hypothetical protein [Spirochaetaceae bacterium]